MQYCLLILFIHCVTHASQPKEGYVTVTQEGYLLKIHHRAVQEVVDTLPKYKNSHLAKSSYANFVFIHGPTKDIEATVAFIKNHIDRPCAD